jgi:uncharacterized membrane protein
MRRTASTTPHSGTDPKRRRSRLVWAALGVVILLLGLAIALGWGTYVVPVAVILGVVAVSFWLLVWVAGLLTDRWYTLP